MLIHKTLNRLDEIADPEEFRLTLSQYFEIGYPWDEYLLDAQDFWDLTKSEIIRILHDEKLRVRPYDI